MLVLVYLSLSLKVDAGSLIEIPLEKQVDYATLIIKGYLKDKYIKKEDITKYYIDKDREIVATSTGGVYTTLIFHVDEVIKGDHSGQEIQVKMSGGCKESVGCTFDTFSYDFEINEPAVLFLKHKFRSHHYMSTSGAKSVFRLESDHSLAKKPGFMDGKLTSPKATFTLEMIREEVGKNEK